MLLLLRICFLDNRTTKKKQLPWLHNRFIVPFTKKYFFEKYAKKVVQKNIFQDRLLFYRGTFILFEQVFFPLLTLYHDSLLYNYMKKEE